MSSYTHRVTELSIERPARRFLHICYCCADDQEVANFLVEGLDMKQVMRTTDQYDSGAILGIDHDVRSVGNFVYDRRGPRTSPAIEVQGWYDPTPKGEPSTDPFRVGIKALGFAVPSVDTAIARLTAMGCSVLADGNSPFDARHAAVLDPRNVTLDLVEDSGLAEGESQMHHLRITVRDLEESLPFYDMLGFDVLERGTLTDAAFVADTRRRRGKTQRRIRSRRHHALGRAAMPSDTGDAGAHTLRQGRDCRATSSPLRI